MHCSSWRQLSPSFSQLQTETGKNVGLHGASAFLLCHMPLLFPLWTLMARSSSFSSCFVWLWWYQAIANLTDGAPHELLQHTRNPQVALILFMSHPLCQPLAKETWMVCLCPISSSNYLYYGSEIVLYNWDGAPLCSSNRMRQSPCLTGLAV